ncbi:neuropeptide FF receptor 1 [Rhinopithecus roxellana]|uniref:neuropeptide FF receptor 1 n=1 Tax=Rhinopithecus roxellana TaxID=61622 RepID=UPI0012373FAC|nr:neuropeptide FF receptor 1 [Rhinopithecus roxellana]
MDKDWTVGILGGLRKRLGLTRKYLEACRRMEMDGRPRVLDPRLGWARIRSGDRGWHVRQGREARNYGTPLPGLQWEEGCVPYFGGALGLCGDSAMREAGPGRPRSAGTAALRGSQSARGEGNRPGPGVWERTPPAHLYPDLPDLRSVEAGAQPATKCPGQSLRPLAQRGPLPPAIGDRRSPQQGAAWRIPPVMGDDSELILRLGRGPDPYIPLVLGEPSQPPNSSWPLSQNGTNAEATPAANLTFSSYYQHTSPVAAMFIVAYALIFLLCMVGNTLVCFIVLKNRHMRTVTNMFILNLAISDLLVGIFCMPTTLVDNLITGWPFDNATCKMSGLVQGMSVSASVFTLVAIAVERFRCIVYPFREKLTLRKALVTIAIIWALALLIMCPSAVTLTVTREEHHFMVDARNRSYPLYSCWEAWPEKGMRKVYTTVLFSHIYLAPLALIVVMYARIARKLCQAPGPARGGEEAADGRAARRRARVVHMLVMVALFFTLSWLPLWALLLLIDYGQLSAPQLHLVTVYAFPFAHWLAFFNSSANPIIYGYFNENFRRGFQAAFRARLCQRPWGSHKEAYSERPGGLLHRRVFVAVRPSDSRLPSESGPSSGAPRPGRPPLRNGRVAHHGLPREGPGCSHLPLTIPAWDI